MRKIKRNIRHKFNAVNCEADGLKFPSTKEKNYYDDLKLRQYAGEVVFFLRQVPFDLPGGSKHRIDFVEFHSDGTVHVVEVKGYDTADGKRIRKIVEGLYPITIEVV